MAVVQIANGVEPQQASHRWRVDVIYDVLDSAAIYLAGVALLGLAFMISYDVLVRFVFNTPLPASVEISQLIQPFVVLLPMALTLRRGQHVKVTLLTQRLPLKAQRILAVLVLAFEVLICALLTVVGWREFWSSYSIGETMMAAIPLPWWVGKFAFPLGIGMLTLYLARQWYAVIKGARHA